MELQRQGIEPIKPKGGSFSLDGDLRTVGECAVKDG